jgi:trimeric autotransporter adhesin
VGGDFEFLGRLTGRFVSFSRAGTLQPSATQVAGGGVTAIAPDGAGGWFIGGMFTSIRGVDCPRLAHIRRNQTLDRRFCRRPNGEVHALARRGTTLYVGGQFTRIDGNQRQRLAAFDTRSGSLRAWNPNVRGVAVSDTMVPVLPSVSAIVASPSYVGGEFQGVGGASRMNLAALDPRTGEALTWRVRLGSRFPGDRYIHAGVTALARSGPRLYIGGQFGRVAGQPRPGVAVVDAESGRLLRWRPKPFLSDYVGAIALARHNVYVGAGNNDPGGVFAFDRMTGRRVSWIRSRGLIHSLSVSGSTLYLGGEFDRIGGQPRSNLASVDTPTDNVLGWAPTLDGLVVALAAANGNLAVGGDFNAESESVRRDLAALDAETGEVHPLRVELKGEEPTLDAISVRGSTLLLAGYFDGVASEKRSDLVAVDSESGEPTPWNPSIEKLMLGLGLLAELDGTVYVAGGRTQPRTSRRSRPSTPNPVHRVRAPTSRASAIRRRSPAWRRQSHASTSPETSGQ